MIDRCASNSRGKDALSCAARPFKIITGAIGGVGHLNLERARKTSKKMTADNFDMDELAKSQRIATLVTDLAQLTSLTDPNSKPNLNALSAILRDVGNLTLNVKFFGYDLARRCAAALPIREGLSYNPVGLCCKPSTQADMESDWVAYWCAQLKTPVVFHRKLWECAYFLQALEEASMLRPGVKGLGFGCGKEPFASYLASRGVDVLATDLAPESEGAKAWIDTNQHTGVLDGSFMPHLVDRESFDKHVRHRFVDMNAIPHDLQNFDFCWSICALEHLGTLERGMQFVINSLKTLRPGGIAIHTTEFNFVDGRGTVDNWPTVLPQRKHFMDLADRLAKEGHELAQLDFDVGSKPLDQFIDVPPYPGDPNGILEHFGTNRSFPHLKLSIDGFASTCFGLIVKKAG